jgi:SAM-dependent methyltransferase
MRKSLLDILRCPACGTTRAFVLEVAIETSREIREGRLACGRCGRGYDIFDGICDLMCNAPDFVRREAAGLERFAERMRRDGWDKARILGLPNEPDGYWYTQATSMNQLLARVPFATGQKLLDVGSNTCWASNVFAQRGLDVIALDIAATDLQGLRTAEYFMESGETYFERVLGVMFDIPLADEALDYVFCCEVLHHNDRTTLTKTLGECYRVLKPGGHLLIINETMKFPLDLKHDHAQEVAEFEGYEHTFFFHQYYLAARRAGFHVSVVEPRYVPAFSGEPVTLPLDAGVGKSLKLVALHLGRKNRVLARLYLAYKNVIRGGVALNMICTKPVPAR